MMPRARDELIDAALSYSEGVENRLTELLATTLESHDEFAKAVFAKAELELPDGGMRFEVYTQKAVAEGARPDMVILGVHEEQGLVAQLWSEHKLSGGSFRDLQLEDYRDQLAKAPGRGRLIGIVGEVDAESAGRDWKMMTWQEIAEIANAVGREWGDARGGERNWRRAALDPVAPARERILHEFIRYVERENDAVVDALDKTDIETLRKMAQTTTRLWGLLDRAGQLMKPGFEPEPDASDADPDGHRFWQLFKTPEGSWLERLLSNHFDVYPELMISADDHWWSASKDEPAVAAGYTLDERLYEPLAAREDWLKRLREAGVDFDVYFGLPRVYCTKAVAELVGEGGALGEQARALARWASESLELVGTLDPGEFELPPKRRRRSRRNGEGHETQRITE